jgi:gliding motility-associated-like protein
VNTIYVFAESNTTPVCTSETSFTVTISDELTLDPIDDVFSCDSFELPGLSAGAGYYLAPGGVNPFVGTTVTQTTTLYVYVSQGSCSAEEAFTVNIGQTPELLVDGGCQGNDYVVGVEPVNGSFDPATATYEWTASGGGVISGASTGQSVIGTAAGDYTVVVTSGGCSQSGSHTAGNVGCIIQKGISVNGDGDNDTFDLSGQGVRQLDIFNRYGMVVYSKSNYQDEWGGQSDSGEDLPDGTYYFVFQRESGETKSGWIYLNRAEN